MADHVLDLSRRPGNVPKERVVDVDMYRLAGIEDGYLEAWTRLHENDIPELVWTPHNGGHWIATSGELISEIYNDPLNFSSEVLFIPKAAGEKYAMVPSKMDPPEHRPYREVVNKGLNLKAIREREPAVRAIAVDLIQSFVNVRRCDFVEQFSGEFPIRVFMMMADLPMSDASKLRTLAGAMTRPEGETPEEMAASLDAANKGFFDYVSPIIDARMGGDGGDIISLSINSQIHGHTMDRDKLLGMISLLLLAGLDSVTNFLNMVMDYLSRHPEIVSEMVANPGRIRQGVEEMFRRFPLVAAARMVAKDIERDGVSLRPGEMVLLPTALANLDAKRNPDPWKLDFGRRQIAHSTFGEGPHRCAGLHLARLETTVMLEEWLERIPQFEPQSGHQPKYQSGVVALVEDVHLQW